MKMRFVTVRICFLLGILLSACGLATTSTASEPTVTQITIDGDPADWAGYDVLLTDPEGDHSGGGFDIAALRAFTNDQYLYVLIETHKPATDYVQVDLDVSAGGRMFIVSFPPGAPGFMGEVTSGQFEGLGEVGGGQSAAGEAVEYKMPLSAFEDITYLRLGVRVMGGECCDADWYAIDEISRERVVQVDEIEPKAEVAAIPQVCAAEIAPSAPFGTLEPAPLEFAQPGYAAEWFVAPGVFNMPQEVFVTPAGDLLVYAVRGHTLSRVADDGMVTLIAKEVYGYLGDVDAQGNLYLHFHPGGRVTRISPDGTTTVVADSPEIQSACDSGFGIGPDGNMYLALNPCLNQSDLFQITPAGQITHVADGIEPLQALRTAPDGRFLAAGCNAAYELSLDDYSLTLLGRIPGSRCVSPGGLAVDDEGNIYLSTGSRSPGGEVYRIDANGEVTLLAEIPGNGLSGIEWLPDTGEIVGGQLRQGGLIAVGPDGTIREIVPGNGLVTPMGMAFSPCGELAVANDDGGMMTLVDPGGQVSWFFDYVSFTPPTPFVVFGPDGLLYASEGAPGMPERVSVVRPGETLHTLVQVDMPCGLALRTDGTLIVAETSAGRITEIGSDGSTAVLAEGLDFPQALALDADGNLYASTGTSGQTLDEVFNVPSAGDTIIRITQGGDVTTVAGVLWTSSLVVGPSGDLFAARGGNVERITPDGSVSTLVAGFQSGIGLAFDLAGYLYVSDSDWNGIVRIAGFPQGTLSGVVTDISGALVQGARVQVLAVAPIVVGQVVTTGADGRFSLPAAPRTYSVTVTATGYETKTLEGIEVSAGQETMLEIEL